MARVSLSLYEEAGLPVEVQGERFAFGEVVYVTLGGFGTPDMVCVHLSPAQLTSVEEAIAVYRREAARGSERGGTG